MVELCILRALLLRGFIMIGNPKFYKLAATLTCVRL